MSMETSKPTGSSESATAIDPITAQVIWGALESIAIDMGHKLTRMAYSSIIRESEDFGAALLDTECRQLCESAFSTPLQLGPIPGYVRGIQKLFAERGECFLPGDVIMHNSPYYGASHGPDVAFCVPVFSGDTLLGFSVTTAHHLDIGALVPGSCGIVDAVDAYAEGLQFKAVKVYEKGVKNRQFWHFLKDNIRASEMVLGDMEAQISACRTGEQRFLEVVGEYGMEQVLAASSYLMQYSETMMRRAIAQLPDGTYSAEGHFDGFADDPDEAKRDIRIRVTVTVKDSDIYVDFTGSAPQIDDRPVNMPFEGTVAVAVYLVLRSILLDTETNEYIPQNSGLVRPIHIEAPLGSICNPRFPAPTIARFCPGNIVADTVMRALSQAVPHQVSAGVGNLKVIAYSGLIGERYWVYMDITEGSYGGRSGKDGMDCVDTLYANTRNNPIEDVETHYPLRVTRYEMRENCSGAGQWRGGTGSIRDVMLLSPGRASIEGDGHRHAPWGIFGGKDGGTGALTLEDSAGTARPLPAMISNLSLKPGDILRTVSPCGGGYGNAFEREPGLVLKDCLNGLLSLAAAREQYGVSIQGGVVDETDTANLRK
jgi:N-methylhydantoinase B